MANTSYLEDQKFAADLFGNILEKAVEWIGSNLAPEEVFSEGALENWAMENEYVKENEEG